MGRFTSIDGNVLDGVSATTLWTLRNRAEEAKRSDGVIRDPWAITLFDAIDYDYDKFGRAGQPHGLRALAFDAATRDYLSQRPKASVVALAEGLQTSFWRLDRDGVVAESHWYSIDLPPVMKLRAELLPDATSASPRWPSRRSTSAGWIRWTRPTACSSPLRGC